MITLTKFNPSPALMNKVYWLNRYSDRLMQLHASAHDAFLEESMHWGSERHLSLQVLLNRINFRIYLLARSSSLLTKRALISE